MIVHLQFFANSTVYVQCSYYPYYNLLQFRKCVLMQSFTQLQYRSLVILNDTTELFSQCHVSNNRYTKVSITTSEAAITKFGSN
jgi:hypothetical protein